MQDINDLIEFENENTKLDFKREQYRREKNFELIKDIMSMANAHDEGDKFIIVGVKHQPSGEKEIFSIPNNEFIDASNYQQLFLNARINSIAIA